MSIVIGSFCKESVSASTEYDDGQDVDLDDPELWEKDFVTEAPHESIG